MKGKAELNAEALQGSRTALEKRMLAQMQHTCQPAEIEGAHGRMAPHLPSSHSASLSVVNVRGVRFCGVTPTRITIPRRPCTGDYQLDISIPRRGLAYCLLSKALVMSILFLLLPSETSYR